MVSDATGSQGHVGEFGRRDRPQSVAKMYTIFFDHLVDVGYWSDILSRPSNIRCTTKVTVEDIASMDGTSMTILLSENEDAGHWIWYADVTGWGVSIPVAASDSCFQNFPFGWGDIRPPGGSGRRSLLFMEEVVGFCYPNDLGPVPEEIPNYVPLLGGAILNGADAEGSPLFINEGRWNSGARFVHSYRTARPSSGHPGGVVAAFCDGHVQFLRDDMDKTLFVRLCRPGSGVILNPKDLGW